MVRLEYSNYLQSFSKPSAPTTPHQSQTVLTVTLEVINIEIAEVWKSGFDHPLMQKLMFNNMCRIVGKRMAAGNRPCEGDR